MIARLFIAVLTSIQLSACASSQTEEQPPQSYREIRVNDATTGGSTRVITRERINPTTF